MVETSQVKDEDNKKIVILFQNENPPVSCSKRSNISLVESLLNEESEGISQGNESLNHDREISGTKTSNSLTKFKKLRLQMITEYLTVELEKRKREGKSLYNNEAIVNFLKYISSHNDKPSKVTCKIIASLIQEYKTDQGYVYKELPCERNNSCNEDEKILLDKIKELERRESIDN